ncbi:MAG: type II toxin-antitoxin system RelE/ParE family toxin [Deltaproteobacteria bacterium]|nr:type II toxin-antitoxin system RelE/ParE family toxin [Deltaproteobacteria bacterium]
MDWTVEYYKDREGKEPTAEFIEALSNEAKVKVFRIIKLLKDYGVLLKEPYTRQVKGKIRELRIKDNQGAIRILYFTYTGKRFILLHGFVKKTDKTPVREVEVAEKRLNDFIQRQGG